MNIFYLDSNPTICAKMHLDKHVIKMVTEYSQLLCTAHRVLDGREVVEKTANGRRIKRWYFDEPAKDDLVYKACHVNHPSAIWVRQSNNNYNWLAFLLAELSKEYTYRYGREHGCSSKGVIDFLMMNSPANIPVGYLTQPTPAMPEGNIIRHSNNEPNSLLSYRHYYTFAKARLHSWKGKVAGRDAPTFIKEFQEKYGVK